MWQTTLRFRRALQPRSEKHGCHAMILPWSYRDHGEKWSWSCHDDGMAAMFLDMVIMIHGMIMIWLPCFPWFIPWSWYYNHVFHVFFWRKTGLFVNIFSYSCCHIPLYGTLDWLLNSWVSIIKRRLLQKELEFSSFITKQQVLIKRQFQYNIHITAFCYFW